MNDLSWLQRTELLTGRESLEKLGRAHVLIVGMGGVGSFAAEFICRGGVGKMTIVDGDVIDPTNRNRQLPALATTHGQSKVDWMAQRLRDINPEIALTVIDRFLTPENLPALLETPFDYVVDCIDSFTPKLFLVENAWKKGYPVASSMGAGGRVDPTQVRIADLYQSKHCRLAFYMRKRLRKKVGKGVTVVYSEELQNRYSLKYTDGSNYKRSYYGTMSYLPATFGAALASIVLRKLGGIEV